LPRVIITGSEGFIGRHLATRLPDCIRFDLRDSSYSDTRNFDAVDAFWKETQADTVVHLAANPDPGISNASPDWDAHNNIVGTINVLRASLKHGIKSFIYASTAHVYKLDPLRLPQDETMECEPLTPYAISKYGGEMYCRFFQTKGLDHTVLRFFNGYGPYQGKNFAIPELLRRVSDSDPGDGSVKVRGPPDDSRDFIFVEDIVDAIKRTLDTRPSGETINIGSGIETSTKNLCESIAMVAGKQVSFEYAQRPPGRIAARFRADNRKAKTVLGWEPRFDLIEGLKRTADLIDKRSGENPLLEVS